MVSRLMTDLGEKLVGIPLGGHGALGEYAGYDDAGHDAVCVTEASVAG